MTVKRALEILTPEVQVKTTPEEFDEALALAREALRYWEATSMAPRLRALWEKARGKR